MTTHSSKTFPFENLILNNELLARSSMATSCRESTVSISDDAYVTIMKIKLHIPGAYLVGVGACAPRGDQGAPKKGGKKSREEEKRGKGGRGKGEEKEKRGKREKNYNGKARGCSARRTRWQDAKES